MHKKTLAASLIIALGIATATARAEEVPEVHTYGNVTYVTGGVGEQHEQAMEAVRKDYPLSMLFIRKDKPRNAYLADIAVTIKDAKGKVVLEATSDGPFLYVKIPPGRYTVSATHEGNTRTAQVYVPRKGHKNMVFEWSQ